VASEVLGAFLSDALAISGFPLSNAPGSVAALALQRVFQQRAEAAREVLQDELRRGDITSLDAAGDDAAAAILFRYLRAAQEGAARRNLRLLAQVIRGQLSSGNLVADEFLSYADVLAPLRREEIVLLGAMAQRRDELREAAPSAVQTWTMVENELFGTAMFPTRGHIKAAARALGRSGLVLLITIWNSDLTVLSVLFDKFAEFCDFEAASNEV